MWNSSRAGRFVAVLDHLKRGKRTRTQQAGRHRATLRQSAELGLEDRRSKTRERNFSSEHFDAVDP
jgi:hypothetical protein